MRTRLLTPLLVLFFTSNIVRAGAWGHQSFANDSALDWVGNELKPGGMTAVQRAISLVVNAKDYLEATDCCYAIAACEVLAAAQGRASADLPKDVAAIAKKLPSKASDSLRKEARAALDRIITKSELRSLWADAKGDFEKWKKSVEDLKSRV